MIIHNSINLDLLILLVALSSLGRSQAEQDEVDDDGYTNGKSCSLYMDVGANYLSVNDIVVKSPKDNIACIKARFSLAIKVEEEVSNLMDDQKIDEEVQDDPKRPQKADNNNGTIEGKSKRVVLGYLPLDTVVGVEDTCPDPVPASLVNTANGTDQAKKQDDELEMVVLFECGKLAFSFKRKQNFYLSALRGLVNLGSSTIREFVSEKPMFFTSDLAHHFKFNELVGVNSVAQAKAFILTANFYNLEFEAFRNTKSREFVMPPDEKSKAFQTP